MSITLRSLLAWTGLSRSNSLIKSTLRPLAFDLRRFVVRVVVSVVKSLKNDYRAKFFEGAKRLLSSVSVSVYVWAYVAYFSITVNYSFDSNNFY